MSSSTSQPMLRHDRAFRAIWTGQTASFFGDQVTGLALPLLGLLRLAPPLWVLALVVLALGTGQLFFQVAYRAWLPQVTGESRLARATAGLEASDAASVLVGYPLAGALIAAVGPVLALGADALSYVVSALTLGRVGEGYEEREGRGRSQKSRSRIRRTRRTRSKRGGREEAAEFNAERTEGIEERAIAEDAEETEEVKGDGLWAEGGVGNRGEGGGRRADAGPGVRAALDGALAGVRHIWRTPAQRVLKGAGAALYLDAGAVGVLLATLTQLRLHLPPTLAGVVFGAAGVGGLLGSALAPRLYERGWRRGLAGALVVAAIGAVGLAGAGLLAPAPGFALAFAANLTLDGAVALGFVLTGTANTLVTPAELRGRVNAASTIYSSAVRGAAALAAGALAASGNPLPAFLALAACCLGAAGIALGRQAAA